MNNNEKLAKIAVNKSLLKEYSNSENERIVYINDGTEFQIQIFNPYSYTIGVTFTFNGNNSSYQMLVLRPGERIWLDRYLNNESRLLFSTYTVGASEEVKKAIKDNGNLKIEFYKEYTKTYEILSSVLNSSITFENKNYNNAYNAYNVNNSLSDQSARLTTTGDMGTSISTFANTLDLEPINANINNVSFNSKSLNSISGETGRSFSANQSTAKSIETGRIEEGSHSNQKFQNVYKDFETWPFKTEYIKILPTSQKQINSNDLTKKYCHQCGRKLSQKYKFCPFCGAKQ